MLVDFARDPSQTPMIRGPEFFNYLLYYEKEIAEILGIPYDEVMQAGLIPVAYTQDTDFKPGWRAPLDTVVRWETW